MEQSFYDKYNSILSNITVKEDTGCHITHIQPYKGSGGYPRVHFSYLKKRFQVNAHTFVFRMHNGIPPYSKNDTGECSHLCHNFFCIRVDHIHFEPHSINNSRKRCNKQKQCLGHEGYPNCISFSA